MKLLIWAAICVVVVLWLARALKSGPARRKQSDGQAAPSAAESMLRCAHCGLHVPRSEALFDPAGGAFCSKDHLALHAGPKA